MKKVKTLIDYLDQLPIMFLVDEFNIDVDIKGRCSCLLHEETKPSMFIDFQKNKWHCFSCQQGGGNSSLVDHYYRHNLNTKNYYDSLNKFLHSHNDIKSEINIKDLGFDGYSSSNLDMQNIIDKYSKFESSPELTRINLIPKPKKDSSIEEIIQYFINLQTGGSS